MFLVLGIRDATERVEVAQAELNRKKIDRYEEIV